jgi:hypothetical protein
MTSQDAPGTGPESVVPSQSREGKPTPPTDRILLKKAILFMGLALLAGAAAWEVGEYTMGYAKVSRAAAENYRDSTALNREMPGVNATNGALTFGVFGGLLGMAMGLGGGLTRRSPIHALMGAIAGLLLGAVAGGLPSLWVMPWQWRHRNDDPSTQQLLMPLLVHFALWGATGLAAGLAFGLASGGSRPYRILEAALAGLAGAMLGTFVFEMAGAILFPLDHTASPFSSTAGTRLLARLCVAGFVGLGALRSLPTAKTAAVDDLQ